PVAIALGAVVGIVALGVVIAATHGVAIPLIAGIGATILLGHGGAAAGFTLGFGVLAGAATLAGSVVGAVGNRIARCLIAGKQRVMSQVAESVDRSNCSINAALTGGSKEL